MNKERFLFNGKPLSWIEDLDISVSEEEDLSLFYGQFVLRLSIIIRKNDRTFPNDILSVGDDWYQLLRFNPPYYDRDMVLYDPPDEAVFGVYPIQFREFRQDRPGIVNLDSPAEDLLETVRDEVITGETENRRMLEKLALFDFSKCGFPAIPDTKVLTPIPERHWWGERKLLGFTPPRTVIYHVTNFTLPREIEPPQI